jgi:hypothetical protein
MENVFELEHVFVNCLKLTNGTFIKFEFIVSHYQMYIIKEFDIKLFF